VVLVNKRPADFQSVEALYTEIETELCARQDAVNIRLETWREYKTAKEAFSSYMQYIEKEKRALELPFLQLKRLPITQTQIQKLIDQLQRGEELLSEVRKHHSDLIPHCPSDMSTQLNQELVSYVSRFANLQASLRTWHDNIVRLHDTSKQCEDKMSRLSTSLSSIREEMTDEKPPTSFAELKKFIKTLDVIIYAFLNLHPHLIIIFFIYSDCTKIRTSWLYLWRNLTSSWKKLNLQSNHPTLDFFNNVIGL
jgi:chromosome segregation ATPase